MMDVNKMPERFRTQIMEQLNEQSKEKSSDSNSSSRTKLEPIVKHEFTGKDEFQESVSRNYASECHRITGKCRLVITHYRYRLIDYDNLCVKYFLDEGVLAGILPDDRAEIITEVAHKQIKVGRKYPEMTVFEFEEI